MKDFPFLYLYKGVNKSAVYTINYLENILNYFSNILTWKGLPEEINTYYLERLLNSYGVCAFWKLGDRYLISPVVVSERDYLGYPTKGRPTNIYRGNETIEGVELNSSNAVFIINNYSLTPTALLTLPKIQELSKLMDDYLAGLQFLTISDVIFTSGENVDETFKNMKNSFNKQSGMPIRVIDLSLKIDTTNREPLSSKIKIDDMLKGINALKQDIKESLGIMRNEAKDQNNRHQSSEIEIGNKVDNYILQSRIITREQSLKSFKEVFDLDITIEDNLKKDELEDSKNNEVNENENE